MILIDRPPSIGDKNRIIKKEKAHRWQEKHQVFIIDVNFYKALQKNGLISPALTLVFRLPFKESRPTDKLGKIKVNSTENWLSVNG